MRQMEIDKNTLQDNLNAKIAQKEKELQEEKIRQKEEAEKKSKM